MKQLKQNHLTPPYMIQCQVQATNEITAVIGTNHRLATRVLSTTTQWHDSVLTPEK